MNQLSGRYLDDFAVGQTFGSGRLRIDKEQIFAFAAEFDPQPFHLDEAAARDSIFAGLAECRWPRPVRPGDELRIECEVIEVRPSKSRPEQGLIKLRTTTLNQDGEAVLVQVVNMVVLRRKDIRQD